MIQPLALTLAPNALQLYLTKYLRIVLKVAQILLIHQLWRSVVQCFVQELQVLTAFHAKTIERRLQLNFSQLHRHTLIVLLLAAAQFQTQTNVHQQLFKPTWLVQVIQYAYHSVELAVSSALQIPTASSMTINYALVLPLLLTLISLHQLLKYVL